MSSEEHEEHEQRFDGDVNISTGTVDEGPLKGQPIVLIEFGGVGEVILEAGGAKTLVRELVRSMSEIDQVKAWAVGMVEADHLSGG